MADANDRLVSFQPEEIRLLSVDPRGCLWANAENHFLNCMVAMISHTQTMTDCKVLPTAVISKTWQYP